MPRAAIENNCRVNLCNLFHVRHRQGSLMKGVTVKPYQTHQELKEHLQTFLVADNFGDNRTAL
jgi:hypothetical protein